jgi:hypothetical protein
MRITAGRLEEHTPRWISKSETEERTSTTSLTPDSELQVELDPGVWDVHMWLSVAGTDGSGGVRTVWGLDSGMSLIGFKMVQGPAAPSTNRVETLMRTGVHSAGAAPVYGARQDASTFAAVEEWAVVQVSSTGILALEWAQQTLSTDGAWVGIGSFIRADRIG